jgi:hypothetical protein
VPTSDFPAAFQHVEKTNQIGCGVCVRIKERVADACLSSEMHDVGKTMFCKQLGKRLAMRNVNFLEMEPSTCLKLGEARLLQARIVISVEIVNANDRISILR